MEKKGAHNSLNTISHCSQKAKMKLLQLLSSIVSMVIHFGFCVTFKDKKVLLTPCNKFSPNHPPYDLRFFQPPECIIYAKSTLSCFKSEM